MNLKKNKNYDLENPFIILKNFLVNFFSTSGIKIIGILLVPIYTNYLSTEEYGILELMFILSNFLLILYPMGLKSAGGRLYFDYIEKEGPVKEGKRLKKFISQNIFLITISTVLQICLFLVIGSLFWNKNYLGLSYSPFIITIIIASGLRVYYPIVLKIIQSRGDSVKLAKFTITYSLLGVLLNILFIVGLDYGIIGFLYSYILTGIVIFILTLSYINKDLIFSINIKIIKESVNYSLPILLSTFFAFSYNFTDRFIISLTRSNSEVGIYSLAAKYAILLSLVHVAITRVLNPYCYSIMSKNKINNKNLILASKYNIVFIVYLGFFMALFSQEIINIMTPDSFNKAVIIAPILVLAYVIQSFYYNSIRILFFFKKTKVVSLISILAGGLSLILNMVLIPRFGSFAAALVLLFCMSIHSFTLYYFAQKTYKLKYNYSEFIVLIVALVIIITCVSNLPIGSKINIILIKFFLFVFISFFVFFKYFGIKKTKQILSIIKSKRNKSF